MTVQQMRQAWYDEGMDAYLDGKKLDDCPYTAQSVNWLWWRRGWFGWC